MLTEMANRDRDSSRSRPAVAIVRIRASASALEFALPPTSLRLKLFAATRYWSLFLQPIEQGSRLAPILAWIEPWSPLRIEFGSRQVLRADFDPLPTAWLKRFRSVDLQDLIIHPNDIAIATVRGTHAALAAFARTLTTDTDVNVHQVQDAPRDRPILTASQDKTLRAAVEAGYYQIPRPLNLRQLADKLGISSASLSERLRRAEAHVILHYTRNGNVTPWDYHTIFNAHRPDDERQDEDRQDIRAAT